MISSLPATIGLAPVAVTVDFGEPVTGFEQADIVLNNLALSNFTDAGLGRFTFDLTATTDGIGRFTIATGAALTLANVPTNPASSPLVATVASRPALTLREITPPAAPGDAHRAVFDISDPGGREVTIASTVPVLSSLTNTQGSSIVLNGTRLLTVQFRPTGGLVTVTFPAGLLTDIASGNPSAALGPVTLGDFDVTPPAPVLSGLASSVGLAGDEVTVDFGEAVTGFDLDDLELTNLSASNLADLGGGRFTFDVTATGDGPASLTIPAGAAQDAAGNASTEASETTEAVAARPEVTFDRVEPTTRANEYRVHFNVTAPGGGEIGTQGAYTVANFSVASGPTFGATGGASVEAVFRGVSTGGPVSFTFPAGYFRDLASGNESLAAGPFEIGDFDVTPPAPVLSGLASTVGLAGDAVAVDFSEEVTGFDLDDLELTNLSAANLTDQGGGTFTFDVTATGDGPASITIPAGAAQDAAGNPSTATEATTAAVASRPEVSFLRVDPGAGENAYIILFDVSAPGGSGVTGQTSLTVPNFALQSASPGAVTADTPRIEFAYGGTATGGPVSFTFPAGFFTDGASGNTSLEQGPFEVGDFDLTPPTVTLSGTPGFPGDPYPLTITFSEPVSGLAAEEITTDGATILGLVNTCGGGPCAGYTAQVQADPGREFDHSVSVPATAAEDAAGNGNLAPAPFTPPPADGSAPVATISGLPDGFTGPLTATLTFDWGEEVFGFDRSDITVTGGTLEFDRCIATPDMMPIVGRL
ncbi:hypothetical protein HKCCSP123_08175, partial [Rhodobacterales bacterium HKCCSP123]|nr:hypothetical protein [Rhodobacterales bacterium HKCCSP123]